MTRTKLPHSPLSGVGGVNISSRDNAHAKRGFESRFPFCTYATMATSPDFGYNSSGFLTGGIVVITKREKVSAFSLFCF